MEALVDSLDAQGAALEALVDSLDAQGAAFLGAALVGTGREEAALEVEVVFLGVTAELDMVF